MLVYIVLTQFTNESLKAKCFKVKNIKSHSKESKAFLKSIETKEPSSLCYRCLHNLLYPVSVEN
jgi:hypothetical protein